MKTIVSLTLLLLSTISPLNVYIKGDDVYLQVNSKITFDNNDSKLTYNTKNELNAIALQLIERSKLKIEIEAHTDIDSRKDEALLLTQKRANCIRDYLISRGVNPKNITAVGYGFEKPLVEYKDLLVSTPKENEINRRIEIKLINTGELGKHTLVR